MTNEELEIEFGKILAKNKLAFSSNLNPFDVFKLGYNLALSQHDVIKNEVAVCEHLDTENLYCEVGWSIEGKRCKRCKQTVL